MLPGYGSFESSTDDSSDPRGSNDGLEPGEGRYIVVLNDSIKHPGAVASDQAEDADADVGIVYRHALKGYAAILPSDEVAGLNADPRVKYVVRDRVVHVFAQSTPTGIDRTYASNNTSLDIDGVDDVRVNADIAVLDTGIASHPDLNVYKRTDCVVASEEENAKCTDGVGADGYGHGTHVAGIAAALDNGIGVVGVAPGARLWAVKVLDSSGSGYESEIAAGIDWVTAHASEIEVANMSLGCECALPAVDEALEASAEAGVVYTVSAGNDSQNVSGFTPAGHPDAITVSALADYDGGPGGIAEPTCGDRGADDQLANFSNFGTGVTVAAPGVCINSTLPSSGSYLCCDYGMLSGTSMAAPHVAGAAAILAAGSNPNSLEDVEAIRQQIVEEGNQLWTDTSKDGVQEPLLAVGPPSHKPVAKTSPVTEATKTSAVLNGVVNPNGAAADVWFQYGKTSAYGTTTSHVSAGSGVVKIQAHQAISTLESGTEYHYRVVVENANGTAVGLDHVFSTPPLSHARNLAGFDSTGAAIEPLGAPAFTAVDETKLWKGALSTMGTYWVTDSANDRVMRFTTAGRLIEILGTSGSGEGQLDHPTGIELNPYSGELFVSDSGNDRIVVYGPGFWTGGGYREYWPLGAIGDPDELESEDEKESTPEFDEPMGLAFAPAPATGEGHGGLLVADAGNDRIQFIEWENWTTAGIYGTSGSGEGQLDHPTDISLIEEDDDEGEVHARYAIVDSGNDRVQIVEGDEYADSVAYLDDFGSSGSGEDEFTEPASAAVDPTTGDLNVVDTGNHRVLQFLTDGTPVAAYGSGPGVAYDEYEDPSGISFTDSGEAYVADTGNQRVGVWKSENPRPWPSSEEVLSVDSDSAHLSGAVTPKGSGVSYRFEYEPFAPEGGGAPDDICNYSLHTEWKSVEAGSKPVAVDAWVESLEPSYVYCYRLVASGPAGETKGKPQRFITDTIPPVVTTVAATNVMTSRATLQGKIASLNDAVDYYFEYGTTTSYGKKTILRSLSVYSVSTNPMYPTEVSAAVTNLSPNTTYHYRFVGSNGGGTTYGADKTLTTNANGVPYASTAPSQDNDINAESLILRGIVNPEALSTTYQFEYGTTTAYGSKQPLSGKGIGQGTTDLELAETVSSLKRDTTYHYRIAATNSAGTSYGTDKALKTSSPPAVTTDTATKATTTGATLNATVNPAGYHTTYQFEYGKTTAYGSVAPSYHVLIGSGTSNVSVHEEITGLQPGETYHYRISALNLSSSTPTSYGEDKTFTTAVPKVVTETATDVTQTLAELHGVVNPGGIATDYYFEYGKTTSYGAKAPASAKSAGTGSTDLAVAETLEGLEGAQDYHYRLVASNSVGTSYGADMTFATKLVPLFKLAFGSSGSGNGQLEYPFGITTDSSGNIWVADLFNHRIQKFNSKGEYVLKIGSAGYGDGQFNEPMGVAVDSSGNVWVADSGSNRIQKFNSKGEYLSQFGTFGTGNGQLYWPLGIEIDAEGNLWVADTGNHRIQKFNSKGEYLAKFGSEGSGNGQFQEPGDVAVDSSGNFWVVDSALHRIQKFNSKGEYILKSGSEGSGNGQLYGPYGIATDAEGNVWVADSGNNRIQKFNSDGKYLSKFGSYGSGSGQFKAPAGIAVDATGGIWVSDSENNRVQKWARVVATTKAATGVKATEATLNATVNPSGEATTYQFEYGETTSYGSKAPASAKSAGSGSTDVEVSEALEGLKPATTYHFRIRATSSAGTDVGKDLTFTTVAAPSFRFAFGTSGSGNGQLQFPIGMAIDASGNLWVADSGNARIQKFNSNGEYLSQFGSYGTGNGHFIEPAGIAIDSSGNLWIVDPAVARIKKFNSKGEYLSQFGTFGTGNGQLSWPFGIEIDAEGNLWVADSGNHRIQKFNSKGEYLSKFGSEGSGDGQFQEPADVAVDSSGNLWVVDAALHRIQKFNSKGEYILKSGSEGSGNGQLYGPYGIATDIEGDVWVADSGNNRIQKFNASGKYQLQFGSYGSGSGHFSAPVGIAADATGGIWVADGENNRVQKWGGVVATTKAATGVKATEATLNGDVSPEGRATSYYFEYGKTTSYGAKVPTSPKSAGSGTSSVSVSETPAGLDEATTYHYRLVAESGGGVVKGEDKTFTTLTLPGVTGVSPTGVTNDKATVGASVKPNGYATSYYFEYGKTTSYGTKVPTSPKSAGSGSSWVPETETITGLSASTTYHVRIVAESEAGTVKGSDQVLTTGGPPQAYVQAGFTPKAGGAILMGSINPHGLATSYYFEYGKTTSYGAKAPATPRPGGGSGQVSEIVSGLSASTTYHYRLVATNAAGSATSSDQTITTKAGAAELPDTPAAFWELEGNPLKEGRANAVSFQGGGMLDLQGSTGIDFNGCEMQLQGSLWNGPQTGEGEVESLQIGEGCETSYGPCQAEIDSQAPWPLAATGPDQITLGEVVFAVHLETSCGWLPGGSIDAWGDLSGQLGEGNCTVFDDGEELDTNYSPSLSYEAPLEICLELEGEGELSLGEEGPSSPSWALQSAAAPAESTNPSLSKVSCPAQKSCMAVGLYTKAGTARLYSQSWNGSSWTVHSMPEPAGQSPEPAAVSCTAANACTAVGSYYVSSGESSHWEAFAMRWNGSSWSESSLNPPGSTYTQVHGVSCASASSCLAVGSYVKEGSESRLLSQYWNGSSWTAKTVPWPTNGYGGELYDVSCAAEGCMAVGFNETSFGGWDVRPLAEYWDGSKWSALASPDAGEPKGEWQTYLETVSCYAGGCTAGGGFEDESGYNRFAAHWDGSKWATEALPTVEGGEGGLTSLACLSAEACVASGTAYIEGGIEPLAASWDGSEWQTFSLPEPSGAKWAELTDVSCTSVTACTAVGSYDNSGIHPLVERYW